MSSRRQWREKAKAPSGQSAMFTIITCERGRNSVRKSFRRPISADVWQEGFGIEAGSQLVREIWREVDGTDCFVRSGT